MFIGYNTIHAAARRERALAMDRLIFAPIAAFFRRLVRGEARKPSAAFPAIRSC